MIRKPQFFTLIRQGDFKELFVTELGWNRYRGYAQLPPILVDDKEYNITAIAERSGFQILYSEVDEIPTQSIAKKIDTKLRRQALDYICIYRLRGTTHDLWVVPVRTNEKRDLVLVEYDNANAEVLYQKIDGITFELDEQTNIVDLRSKVQAAFAVNSEKITKDFYAGFKKQHKLFADFITGIDDHVETKNNHNKQWYTSVMLNRLMFCYFIQKKGFLDLDVDYLRNKLNYVRANEGEDKFYNFYRSFLRRLFRDGLNTPKHSRDFEAVFGKIPYLNGGMFDEHQLEADYADIDISDEAFISLFDFFDKWNWHLDTRLTASGRDINPDVLGYIFEQYINDRAQMGAYYTKEDITEYIGRNCILSYLFDHVKDATADSAKAFAPDGYVWRTLRESADRYIFDAVKKGYKDFGQLPDNIARGLITEEMHREYSETPVSELPDNHIPLAELRSDWNNRAPEPWGLPNEIWRETIDRLQRCDEILGKINRGEITSINDFITYNLDIRTFAADLIAHGDSRFVGWFYHALQKVTILDPTCGSGAFLFAAMNILEPLYEICIDRMQEFNRENSVMFRTELAEITDKYRSNIQYFIFKSIILRNLYGVDIMVEATEIAKLRLFLKMVAVVDVDRRAENLGLDPLPDIDFNIRCGNTLVGYANKAQLDHDLGHAEDILQELANQDFKQQIDEEMQKVARAYDIFKEVQLRQAEDMLAFKQAKQELRKRLAVLNDKLNHRLFIATSGYRTNSSEDFTSTKAYNDWLVSHQPFHWLAEFYQIIEGNHGFDVIIGNPPYVEYSKRNVNYKLSKFETIKASNLYAYVFERSFSIGKDYIGLIVQLSAMGTESMRPLQQYLLRNSGTMHYGCYPERPQQLFEGACIALSIFICNKRGDKKIFSSGINRVSEGFRQHLFRQIAFINIDTTDFLSDYSLYPKFNNQLEKGIFNKLVVDTTISNYLGTNNNNALTYRTAGGRYWKIVINRPFANVSTSNKTKALNDNISSFELVSVLNTNLFWWYYVNFFDLYNFKDYMIFHFAYRSTGEKESKELTQLGKLLIASYEHNKVENTQFIQSKQQTTVFESFNPSQSKSVIDEIDFVLARHYGFTDEELDFIINYDIKYRMGDELNNE